MTKFDEIKILEDKIQKMIFEISNNITNEISNSEIVGAKKIGEKISIVNFNNLKYNILSPEYYIAEVQANYVKRYFSSVKTFSEFISKIENAIKSKKIKIGNEVCFLNDDTINILKKYMEE